MLAILLLGALSGCSDETPIKIGFVGGLSGRVADLGISGRNGALLAVDDWNRAGGVNGRPIQLLVRDDQQNPQTARKKVTELIDENVVAIIGHMTSSMSVATVPIVNARRIPMISPTSTTTALEGLDDYFFRVIDNTTHYANQNAKYQFETLGRKRIAIVLDVGNRAYTENWANDFKQAFESLGGKIVHTEKFQSSAQIDWTAIALELLRSQADGILIVANSLDAALLCQQIRKIDSKIGLAASEWAATERLIELGGRAVEGILIAQFIDRDDNSPRFSDFKRAYINNYSREPGFASVAGYDATNVVLSALAKADKGDLKNAILASKTYEGVQGMIQLDAFGDSARKTYLTTVNGGKFQAIQH